MTNQASEDNQAFHGLCQPPEEHAYASHGVQGRLVRWVRICMVCDYIDGEDIDAQITSAIRTEKLKLLAEVRERVVGEDEITYANYEDGFFGGKKVTRDKLRESQRIELTKLEAEL